MMNILHLALAWTAESETGAVRRTLPAEALLLLALYSPVLTPNKICHQLFKGKIILLCFLLFHTVRCRIYLYIWEC